jgi:hypothetical protein
VPVLLGAVGAGPRRPSEDVLELRHVARMRSELGTSERLGDF